MTDRGSRMATKSPRNLHRIALYRLISRRWRDSVDVLSAQRLHPLANVTRNASYAYLRNLIVKCLRLF